MSADPPVTAPRPEPADPPALAAPVVDERTAKAWAELSAHATDRLRGSKMNQATSTATEPLLGCATTQQLLDELRVRTEMLRYIGGDPIDMDEPPLSPELTAAFDLITATHDAKGQLNYRTVDAA